MITVDEAIDVVLAATATLSAEDVPLLGMYGRTLAADVVAPLDVPRFDNSAMDGYALRGDELAAGRRSFTVTREIPAGGEVGRGLGGGEAAKIMTGAPLPPGADTVVPVEQTRQEGKVVTIVEPSRPGANVRRAAADVAAGNVVLRRGARLGPAEVGLLASLGFTAVSVARRPRVAIVATGSELVPPGEPLGPGQIHNSNAFTAYGQVLAAGGEPVPLGIARDDVEETRRLLLRAFEEDVVVTSGGVSVGEFDFVKQVQEELGVERRFWGVSSKPGKPVAFGTRGTTLVFGVPGNPVAAMVTFELYVRPALLAMQGRADIYRPVVAAASVEPVKAGKGRLEMRRCRLDRRDGGWLFSTTGPQGSGVLRSMALADGLALIPARHPGSAEGAEFVVMLLQGSSTERPPFPR